MQKIPAFEDALAELCQALGLKPEPRVLKDDMQTIAVGPIEIDVAGSQEGFINFICFPGKLEAPTAEALTVVLHGNCYQEEYPAITTGLLHDSPGQIVLWSRIPLAHATAPMMKNLLTRISDTAISIQRWIKAGTPALDGSKPFIKTADGKSTLSKISILNRTQNIKNNK